LIPTHHDSPFRSIQFDILLAPAFAIKPGPPPAAPPSGPPKRFNPFLPPQPELLVGTVEGAEEWNVVLNKFTVVEGHVLLTTKGGLTREPEVS
jgi:hypothetical protein